MSAERLVRELKRRIERELGVKLPRIRLRRHRRHSPLAWHVSNYVWERGRGGRLTSSTIYYREPSRRYAKRYPLKRILAHELLEIAYMQRALQRSKRRMPRDIERRAHNFAKRHEAKFL